MIPSPYCLRSLSQVIFLLKNWCFVNFQQAFIWEIALKIWSGKTWKMARLAEPRNDKNLEKPGK